jgi:hypothetical protein
VREDYTNRTKYTVEAIVFRKVRGDYTDRTKYTVDSITFRKVRGDYTNRTKYTAHSNMFRKVRGDYTNRTKYSVDSIMFRNVRGGYTNCTHYTVSSISGRDRTVSSSVTSKLRLGSKTPPQPVGKGHICSVREYNEQSVKLASHLHLMSILSMCNFTVMYVLTA